MKPFNLELALSVAKVITRDGRPVKIFYNESANEGHKVAGWVGGTLTSWYSCGRYKHKENETHDWDLFMAPTERKEWIIRCPEYKVVGPFNDKGLAEHWKESQNRPDATIHEITIIE